MYRQKLIKKLERKLSNITKDLVKEYSPATLRRFIKVEKELEVQLTYEGHECNEEVGSN